MKKLKILFDFGFALLIIWIFFINIYFLDFIYEHKDFAYAIFLTQALFVLLIIKKVYIDPINNIILNINDFISWKTSSFNLKSKSPNPNIQRLLKFFNVILNSLSNIKWELLSGKAIKSEVQLAIELQEKLLKKKLEKIPSLDVVAKSMPAWEIWWDSYDIIKQNDNYYIYVWDATWHWVWAWFVMVMVNALISWFSKVFISWAQILANTNEILKPRIKSNILMSLLMLRWDESQKRLFMTWAGHEYLMVYKHSKKKCFRIKSGWIALWMTKNIHRILKEQEIKFELNDIAVLYTDGITEAINRPSKDGKEEMFLENRLVDAIENSPNVEWEDFKSARSVFNNITIELSKFMWYKHTQLDDITLVVIHYRWNQEIKKDYPENIPEDFITEWNWK